MKIRRSKIILKSDCKRVLLRPFQINSKVHSSRIISGIMTLSENEVKQELKHVMMEFDNRHPNLSTFLSKRFEQVSHYLKNYRSLSEERKLLIGAYFSHEYSLEAAALFNPSMVWHPDQSGLPKGSRRFILSLRAVGEGHISSITFRSGVIDAANSITLDEPSRFVTLSDVGPKPCPNKSFSNDYSYEITFSSNQRLSERVIFPASPVESNGIEDARFVEFHDDEDNVPYYATYTAFDGKSISPQLIETSDFLHFKIFTLHGKEVNNKDMALFPRKINGKYAMLSRQDNENIYIMFSDTIYNWNSKTILLEPVFPWEFIKIGTCGSPIETEMGWIVLTHGVGAMRKYTIGALLLDINDPTKVIGRLREPLLMPNANEREGYVPNVVYSCGGLVHGRELIIPYAMSDYASSFAFINIEELLDELTST